MKQLKKLERWGRKWIVTAISAILGVKPQIVSLSHTPTILVVRLDERLGNLLMLTPLLESLKLRFPTAQIDLLANVRGEQVLANHPTVSHFLPFNKKALFRNNGPLAWFWRIRRQKYDVAIDAANPTDPSTTQVLLVRFSGARHTVGPDQPGFGALYSAPVRILESNQHEIDLRLQLLSPFPGAGQTSRMTAPEFQPSAAVKELVRALSDSPYAILNVGARLTEKQLAVSDYGAIVVALLHARLRPLVTYGPKEDSIAAALAKISPQIVVAPPTGIPDLAFLMQHAKAVVSCDTGPMHLSVAVGTPTCGIFVVTDPQRFGYPDLPHRVVNAKKIPTDVWLNDLAAWLSSLK